MAQVTEYPLTAQPVIIAHNTGAGDLGFRMENRTAATTAELLGEGQTLGEGCSIAASEKSSFTLGPGEAIFAAAPTADAVVLRVLSYKSS